MEQKALEQRLRASIDHLLEGVQLIDRTWRYIYVNAKAAEHGQRSADQLVGRTMMESYPGIERTDVFQALRRAMDSRNPVALRNRFALPNGETRWFDLRIDPVPDGICVLSLDVTEQVKADERNTLLAAIVASSEDGIISTTLDGIVLTWNGGAERLYGCSAGDAIGRSYASFVSQDRQAEFSSILRHVAAGDRIAPFETQRVRTDGSHVDVLLTVSPVRDTSGQVTATSGIARDITHRKKIEAEVQRLHNEIQLQRLRVFKATMTTVQDIVNNFLNNLQLVRLEAEDRLPDQILTMFDGMIDDAADKLKTLGDLKELREMDMAAGPAIEYDQSRD